MIQKGTFLIMSDNSGGRFFKCISLKNLYKRVCSGFIIKGVVKKIRKRRRRSIIRVKKGEIYNGLVIQSKINLIRLNGKIYLSKKNLIIILDNRGDPLGTRIFNAVPKEIRKQKKSKIILIAPYIY